MNRTVRLILGMIVGNIAGAVVCGMVAVVSDALAGFIGKPVPPWTYYPGLFLVPFNVGVVAAWIWKPLDLRIGQTILNATWCSLIAPLGAALVFHEGYICLLIGFPLLFVGVVAGALAGRAWFRRIKDNVNLCLAPLVFFAIAAEPMMRGPHEDVVTDEIRIAAPPARVWPHVLAFSEIPDRPNYWLFHLGLPYPTATTNGGDFVGADRACQFSGNAVFREKIAEFEPQRLLTFDIVESPPDPELLGHLDPHRGQFELRDNGDGTTTLVGRTWYRLHVRPAWYFDWWTHDIFRAVHLRVMDNVKRLAEANG
jgi:hypothetical protein